MDTDFGKLILDETPDAVIVTTTDGTVLYWTRGAAGVFGYTAGEAVGRTLAELIVPPQMEDAELAIIADTLASGAANYESMRRTKDGTLIYIDSSSKAVRGPTGQVDYILWTKKDVTSLRVMRDAALVHARFGTLLASMPDAIIIANAAGRIVLANPQADELFGYPPGGLRGALLEVLMPERYRGSHVGHQIAYTLAPTQRPMGIGRELYGLRRDGSEFPVEISLSPLHTDEGMLVMSAVRDITERKRIEHALQEKNAELADANLAKDRFLSSMSHELRTPLNAIIGFTGTLLMQLPGPVNDEQERQLRTIQSSARHLLSLINDILDITKIASGKVELNKELFDCRRLVQDVTAMFAPLAHQKGLGLNVRQAEGDLTVCTDRRAVQQIVINLLNNAIKFTEKGEVRVEVSIDEGTDPAVLIAVVDTGIGIEREKLGLLFKPFTQLDQGTTRQFEGTGLGLHLSERLAALIGARIGVRSTFGEGSVFTLRLPFALEQCAPPLRVAQ
ncbi:PAS domain S-box-containing protein [Pseudoduganella flava]|uniref:Virulence sensor protein BvgS n=1 Tax=Pseudoduganella flava TaxID=871742 RepID=A0A562PZQ7_9BURK|nr:PAS domain S-box protein [Pseudoduganella flava]QGZ38544.1 PAS domain S-box protein [Pseudoduganella flava]TWI49897.1 PAS domain S-box-containing protein [Pseudoduganella flava]